MDIATLRQYLDDPDAACAWLRAWGVADPRQAHAHLLGMASTGLPLDLLAVVCDQLAPLLVRSADADMALNNLDRFVTAARNPLAMGTLFERDPTALATLVQIFSTSQHFSDLLAGDPEGFDLLRLTEGAPVARQMLVEDLVAEVEALDHEQAVLRAAAVQAAGDAADRLRRHHPRAEPEDGHGADFLPGRRDPGGGVAGRLAEAAPAAGHAAAGPTAGPARFVVLAMGKLGGRELNYSSDIDLIFLYDVDGETDGRRPVTNSRVLRPARPRDWSAC